MGPGERGAAQLGVDRQTGNAEPLRLDAALPVVQLTGVVVARPSVEPRDPPPAEEDVRGRLHQVLADDHPLTAVRIGALLEEPLEDRRLGLLRLEDQRVASVTADEEVDPRVRPDAPDAHHLPRRVDQAVLLERVVLARQRAAVRADERADPRVELVALESERSEIVRRARPAGDRRRTGTRRRRWPTRFANTRRWSRVLALARSAFAFRAPVVVMRRSRTAVSISARIALDVDMVVPDVDRPHLRGAPHGLPVAPDPAVTMSRRSAGRKPRCRAQISKLAASRFTSHSHGPGSVSSKSLMSNINFRSGDAKTPKFDRWASPQSWTVIPARGVGARSAAMISAAPRKNVNGETSIRP